MKRSNRFLIGLLATALTFGSLYAFTGPPPGFAHRGHCYDRENCGDYRHERHEDGAGQNRKQAPADRLPGEEQ